MIAKGLAEIITEQYRWVLLELKEGLNKDLKKIIAILTASIKTLKSKK